MPFTSNYLSCLGREIHYTDWGSQHACCVIAWHGLARTCRDMDDLAERLSSRFRVICPDTIGRGLSQWSPQPDSEYCLDFYAKLAVALVDQLGLSQFAWVGTSMGGAIGTRCAATHLTGRITKLVLNDNGPQLEAAAIARIRSYAGQPLAFDTVTELENYFRTVYKSFGFLTDLQWRRLTESSVRRLADGRVTPHYDPAIARQFELHPNDYDLWDSYDALNLPVLCLRGESSDLLSAATALQMRLRGPRAELVTVAGCGHAPALNVAAQLDVIEAFLCKTSLDATAD